MDPCTGSIAYDYGKSSRNLIPLLNKYGFRGRYTHFYL